MDSVLGETIKNTMKSTSKLAKLPKRSGGGCSGTSSSLPQYHHWSLPKLSTESPMHPRVRLFGSTYTAADAKKEASVVVEACLVQKATSCISSEISSV